MKNALIVLIIVSGSLSVSAQKQNVYVDAGPSLAYFDPGFSATYDYNFIKYIGIGLGTQAYVFHPAKTNPRQFTPALFADLRFRIRPEKISQYFILMDFGMDFYKHNNNSVLDGDFVYSVPQDNGIYFGLGIGYFLRLTYRGWGPYASIKLINNIYKRDQFNIVTNEPGSANVAGGTIILSLGFRFGDDTKVQKKY